MRFTNRVSDLLLSVLSGGELTGDVELNHEVIKETVDQLLKLFNKRANLFNFTSKPEVFSLVWMQASLLSFLEPTSFLAFKITSPTSKRFKGN